MKKRHTERRPKKLFGAMAERRVETSPSFTRILSKHGLCPADMPITDAFDLFTRVAVDPAILAVKPQKVVPRLNVLGLYARTAAALERMSRAQKKELLERLDAKFRL